MATTVLTTDDLREFKHELLEEIKSLINEEKPEPKKWLKSSQVRKMLSISSGTLQTLRVDGVIPFSRVGGSIYYAYDDIVKILKENKVVNR
ncbi:DNA-binding protein [Brumimicrobium salinarum]|uniref:DNA-binding protein n=1 Tax=Brumimicrobium salinarum TaxID=2058658 RepID=A0A2I0R2B2_9FLAO|nr:helix-turn-helix domain-containing protein [Brumimicrobium salinarum]PKR80699.1 DNA-binding protein [Brumimicrobium salinarum]